MDFALSEEQVAIRNMVDAFAAEKLAPNTGRWDREAHFPLDEMRELAALGLAGVFVDLDHGGSGLGRLDGALIFEGPAKGCVTTAAFMTIHNMVARMVDRFGDAAQRARFLPGLCAMETVASYCLTEPGSGPDAAQGCARAAV